MINCTSKTTEINDFLCVRFKTAAIYSQMSVYM